jgi:hypothetical protein
MSTQRELGWAGCTEVERDPQRVSGAWVFRGTRIPVTALFENLEDGITLAEFVELSWSDAGARPLGAGVCRPEYGCGCGLSADPV